MSENNDNTGTSNNDTKSQTDRKAILASFVIHTLTCADLDQQIKIKIKNSKTLEEKSITNADYQKMEDKLKRPEYSVVPDLYENALNPDLSENEVEPEMLDEKTKTKMLQKGFMSCSMFSVLANIDLMQQKRIKKGEKLDKKRITLADYQELVDNLKRFNNH